jgi:hypothetical protein
MAGGAATTALSAIPFTGVGGKLLTPAKATFKSIAARSMAYTSMLGASSAFEEGDNIKGVVDQAGKGAVLGVAIPVAFKGIEKGIKALPEIFNITTGGQKTAFEYQLMNPAKAKTAVKAGKSFDQIAQDGLKAVNIVKEKARTEYEAGVDFLSKKYPKAIMEKPIKRQISDIFNSAGQNFDITATKKGVQFAKDGRLSPIATIAEKSRIKEIYKSFNEWKDWSATGSAKFLNYLNKVRKFDTVAGTRESAFVGTLIDQIRTPIFRAYPEIEGLFNNYSHKIQLYEAADELFKATRAGSPTAQATAIQKTAAIFNENKEPLFRIAEQLEKESGVSLLKELSAAELQAVFPNLMRTIAGVGGAVGALINPAIWLALPFVIQKTAAGMTRAAGTVLPKIPAIQRGVTVPASDILNQITNRIGG